MTSLAMLCRGHPHLTPWCGRPPLLWLRSLRTMERLLRVVTRAEAKARVRVEVSVVGTMTAAAAEKEVSNGRIREAVSG